MKEKGQIGAIIECIEYIRSKTFIYSLLVLCVH